MQEEESQQQHKSDDGIKPSRNRAFGKAMKTALDITGGILIPVASLIVAIVTWSVMERQVHVETELAKPVIMPVNHYSSDYSIRQKGLTSRSIRWFSGSSLELPSKLRCRCS